ncbi:hypothetical protein LRS56_10595 [Pseudomonas poae]|nr:hypothetical protein LRS56_10595 [Pseudomonas poae]
MNKLPGSLRLVASLPIYAASVLAWILSIKPPLDAAFILFSGFLTPYRIGQALGNLFACAVLAAIACGLWILARYVRTSQWRKQPKPVNAPLP